MSHTRTLPVVAALVGAAALSTGERTATAASVALAAPDAVSSCALGPSSADLHEALAERVTPTLAGLLEERARVASSARRTEDVERIGELWLTLHRRGQLDRSLERGEGYLTVALRHQDISAHRAEARAARFRALTTESVDSLGAPPSSSALVESAGESPEELLGVKRWLEQLEEPYRTAVRLSMLGCSRREVADQMGVADATVRKWMQRLREREIDAPWD
jgi:DNA-directed RNA polymerase specialized sigma24 family protein